MAGKGNEQGQQRRQEKRRQKAKIIGKIVANRLRIWVEDLADSWTCGWFSYCCDAAQHVQEEEFVVGPL